MTISSSSRELSLTMSSGGGGGSGGRVIGGGRTFLRIWVRIMLSEKSISSVGWVSGAVAAVFAAACVGSTVGGPGVVGGNALIPCTFLYTVQKVSMVMGVCVVRVCRKCVASW